MATLANMRSRIIQEFRREGDSEFSNDVTNAIRTAIDVYKFQKFSFNQTAFVAPPSTDGETNNPWMTTAERLIRARAKLELIIHVLDQPADSPMAKQVGLEIDDALTTLRMSVSNAQTATAGTLGAMKLRIANEINRSDLSQAIHNAITDAIGACEADRFYFNETRQFTFALTPEQNRYTASDSGWEDLADVVKIDFIIVTMGGQPFRLHQRPPEWFENNLITSSNTPGYFGWYEESLILHPPPNEALPLRIGCVRRVGAPATDGEIGNPWMTKAERLIRNRAKAELYTHCTDIADDAQASKFMSLAEEAMYQLEERTIRQTQVGPLVVAAFD